MERFIKELPYELTEAQKRVWREIEADLKKNLSMSRLVQGDVGSGKTVIALLALLTVAYSGYQGALMAPTEVLAKQHYESITKLLEEHRIPFQDGAFDRLHDGQRETGGSTAGSRGRARDHYRHSCSDPGEVAYQNLALVVTDEQHRFGVRQREIFAEKGEMPHVLVMSATPIPRTLAIILYGDLDISVIDELPSNRLPIKNCVVGHWISSHCLPLY